jgi:hypothetical protein
MYWALPRPEVEARVPDLGAQRVAKARFKSLPHLLWSLW